MNYGYHTGSSVGIVMKELVRRAIVTINAQRLTFEVEHKQGYTGGEDLLTTADRAAQEVYVRSLRECFPEYGLVGEEDELNVACSLAECNVYFTLDPIDGTKAFVRRQSHGVGTMIALVDGHEVVAAYVGDVNTNEIYGFRPDSHNVHRISKYEQSERLEVDVSRRLADQYVLLRDMPESLPDAVQRLLTRDRCFKNLEVGGGSIGIAMARLWKGEVGGVVLEPGVNTLWDTCPIWGISQKLGFLFLRLSDGSQFHYEPKYDVRFEKFGEPLIVVHESRLPELKAAWQQVA